MEELDNKNGLNELEGLRLRMNKAGRGRDSVEGVDQEKEKDLSMEERLRHLKQKELEHEREIQKLRKKEWKRKKDKEQFNQTIDTVSLGIIGAVFFVTCITGLLSGVTSKELSVRCIISAVIAGGIVGIIRSIIKKFLVIEVEKDSPEETSQKANGNSDSQKGKDNGTGK